jgi:hypothetical protein
MDTEGRLSGFGLTLLGTFLAVVIGMAAFGVHASIKGGPTAIAPLTANAAEVGDTRATAKAKARAPASAGAARRMKERCAGCGVVESVRRIEHRASAPRVCNAKESLAWMGGNAREDAAYAVAGHELSPVKHGVPPGPAGSRKPTLTDATYRIVVRLRDGSHTSFDESTPRSFSPGERVQVIAGAKY